MTNETVQDRETELGDLRRQLAEADQVIAAAARAGFRSRPDPYLREVRDRVAPRLRQRIRELEEGSS